MISANDCIDCPDEGGGSPTNCCFTCLVLLLGWRVWVCLRVVPSGGVSVPIMALWLLGLVSLFYGGCTFWSPISIGCPGRWFLHICVSSSVCLSSGTRYPLAMDGDHRCMLLFALVYLSIVVSCCVTCVATVLIHLGTRRLSMGVGSNRTTDENCCLGVDAFNCFSAA